MATKKALKTENIIRVDYEGSLDSALKKLSSSHDAAFVFKNNQFVGLINPYHCIISNSYPANAKISHCLFHPPKLRLEDSLVRVAKAFIETKVHYLPVFDEDDNFVGIVSARRLLSLFLNDRRFNKPLKKILEKKKQSLIKIKEETPINEAMIIFKKTKFSKLVVVNGGEKLKGIISYYDVINFLMMPVEKKNLSFKSDRRFNLKNLQVKHLMKTFVLTANENEMIRDIIKVILDRKIGSVVIVDEKKTPYQIITTRDILKYFIEISEGKLKPRFTIPRFFNFSPLFSGN